MPIGQNTEYFVLPEVIEVFVDIRKKAMHAGENSNQCEKMMEMAVIIGTVSKMLMLRFSTRG